MEKIICIIVTYNRKGLLLKCLSAINEQLRRPDCILVVDNASTDGTDLAIKKYVSSIEIRYLKLLTNIGGAGGFYTGLKTAFDYGIYDYFWVMDDDGMPETNCLHELLKHVDNSDFLSPLVVSIENPQEPSFSTLGSNNINQIKEQYKDGIIRGHANPFNGILLSKKFLSQVGFPKKDMFIWGDENEYQARAEYYGYPPTTIINAIHYHPKDRLVLHKDFLGRHKIIHVESSLRNYCKYRNTTYVLKKYKGYINILFYCLRYTYYFLFSRHCDLPNLKLFYGAIYDGLTENFSKHSKYLR